MEKPLSGQTAIVTGGTAGIGRKTVELMAQAGASVLFTGTNAQRGEEVAQATGGTFMQIDALRDDHADELVSAATALGGRLNILVNNAGGASVSQIFEKTTRAAFDEAMTLHVWSPWQVTNAVAPIMRQNGGGSIINIGSIAAQRVGSSSTAYSVSKAALLHLTRCAAAEFGPSNIRVNSVSPGFVETAIHAKALRGDEDRKKKFVEGVGRLFLRRQPLPHLGQPEDVAGIIMFLVSDAAKLITGADIVADGGLIWSKGD